MAQRTNALRISPVSTGQDGGLTPAAAIRLAGALLALAVAAVHVADQGGITALTAPAWIGWGYRLIEIGGVAIAAGLLLPRSAWRGRDWLPWVAGALLGAGPMLGYLASRTVGLPGDRADVANWGYWLGTVSLFVEAALIILSVSMAVAGGIAQRAQPSER